MTHQDLHSNLGLTTDLWLALQCLRSRVGSSEAWLPAEPKVRAAPRGGPSISHPREGCDQSLRLLLRALNSSAAV